MRGEKAKEESRLQKVQRGAGGCGEYEGGAKREDIGFSVCDMSPVLYIPCSRLYSTLEACGYDDDPAHCSQLSIHRQPKTPR